VSGEAEGVRGGLNKASTRETTAVLHGLRLMVSHCMPILRQLTVAACLDFFLSFSAELWQHFLFWSKDVHFLIRRRRAALDLALMLPTKALKDI